MKIFVLFTTAVLVLLSCSKKDEVPPLVGTISFSVDETSYNWMEEEDATSNNFLDMSIYPSSGGGQYTFNVTQAGSTSAMSIKGVQFPIPTTSLAINTPYTYTNTDTTSNSSLFGIGISDTQVHDPSKSYKVDLGDYITSTLTRIQDSRADGTFSARLTRASDSAKVIITNGRFQNIDIEQ